MLLRYASLCVVGSLVSPAIAQPCQPYYADMGSIGLQWDSMRWAVHDDGTGPTVYKVSYYGNFVERLQGGRWVPVSTEGLPAGFYTSGIYGLKGPWGARLLLFVRRVVGSVAERRVFRWEGQSWSDEGVCFGPCQGYDAVGGDPVIADLGDGPRLFGTAAPHNPPYPIDYEVVEHRSGQWATIGQCPQFVSTLLFKQDPAGPRLYAIGRFPSMNGVTAKGIAWWNGSVWQGYANGPAFGGKYAVVADLGLGPRIYCAGFLDDGLNREGIYRWDDGHWTFIGGPDPLPPPSTPPYFTATAVFDDGRGDALYIGGIFRGFSGVTARNIVRYDGQSFEALGAGIVGQMTWMGGFRDIRGWSLFIGGDGLSGAGAGILRQSAALWVGCKEGNCYPNGDLSSTAPILNVNDFVRFLNAYVNKDPYANCTVDAAIDIADFHCFLTRFAAGCP